MLLHSQGFSFGVAEMTLDELILMRNAAQCDAEDCGLGDDMWTRLGVANRHLSRLVCGELTLTPAVEGEIVQCIRSASEWLKSEVKCPTPSSQT